jgi:hypothetical protein
MSDTLILSESEVENVNTTQEVSDEALIDAAKALNASYNGHLRRSVEDFWRLGEKLSSLFQRRHLKGRWADILSEIGINATTDNQARRLFRDTTIDRLSEFKNKTAALRAFGILSTPTPLVEVRSVVSPLASTDKPVAITILPGREEDADGPDEDNFQPAVTIPNDRPDRKIATAKKRLVIESREQAEDDQDTGSRPPISETTSTLSPSDTLEVLAKIAARLEYLAADEIDVTLDHLAQIDRAIQALELLRGKGDAHVVA